MINYSVITPFRDKFDLLEKAIQSVPDRDDIQVILIYNGNGGFPQLNALGHKHTEFVCITSSPDKGAGHARNKGLERAKGRYLLFLDSDDYFTKDAFDSFDKYRETDADIIFFKPTSINLKTGNQSTRHTTYSDKLDKYLKNGNEDQLRYRWEGPVCKMYRRGLIFDNNIRFDETKVSNDAWFSLLAGHNAKKILADRSIVYIITEGETGQSLVKTVTRETVFTRFDVAIKINKFLKKNGKGRLRIRLLGFINTAYKSFGYLEAYRFLKYAIEKRANIF